MKKREDEQSKVKQSRRRNKSCREKDGFLCLRYYFIYMSAMCYATHETSARDDAGYFDAKPYWRQATGRKNSERMNWPVALWARKITFSAPACTVNLEIDNLRATEYDFQVSLRWYVSIRLVGGGRLQSQCIILHSVA